MAVSFVVGGSFIALLSILAERTTKNIAGIIMMFPSTIVLGFFFLGLTTSAEKVAMIIPATLVPLGIVIFSSVIYIYFAMFFAAYLKSKLAQILITFTASSLTWFALASPFAIWRLTNLVWGTTGFFTLIMVAHLILNRNKLQQEISRPRYTVFQIAFRAVFMGTIIATVVLLGKLLNPFWGGVFTMYPAATFAALVTFHFYYQPNQLFHFMRKAPIGSIALFLYTISAMLLFPRFGIVLGTMMSYGISLTVPVLLIKYKL